MRGENGTPGIEIFSDTKDDPFTGRCHIGPITAARPAHGR
jgi:hypothetical protein